jgi:LemA protein
VLQWRAHDYVWSSAMRLALLLLLTLLLSGCGYNEIQRKDEAVNAAWSQVLNVYQRRADLIPNLVATVKGYAQQEQQVLLGVTQARAKVGQIQVNPSDAASLQQFQQAQGELSGALSRLMVVVENYPNLKSDQAFLNLQTQLEGSENRITVERQRYIETVQAYNTHIREFPVNLTAMMFGYDTKPNFTVENERAIQSAPAVDFGAPAAQPPGGGQAQAPAALPAPQPVPAVAPPPGLAPRPSPNAAAPQPVQIPSTQALPRHAPQGHAPQGHAPQSVPSGG